MFRTSLNPFRIFSTNAAAKSRARETKKRRRSRTLRCESLENRELFAVLTGESLVNTATARDQYEAATASAPDGRSVVVWTHQFSTTDTDIRAQRYDRSGNRVGSEIVVASSFRPERQPDVSMDSYGDFVVTWTDQYSSTDTDIKAQRYSSNGLTRGSVINVATSSNNEYDSSVASDANGNFVVAWTRDYSLTDQGVMASMYFDSGNVLTQNMVVSNQSTLDETNADVARTADGRFAITYQTDAGAGDVMLKRYSSFGTLQSTHTLASGTNVQVNPRISMDNHGNTVAVWQERVLGDFDIRARRVTSSGVVGNTMAVRGTFDNEVMPDVALRRDGSSFVVTNINSSRGTSHSTEMSTSGTINRTDVISNAARLEAVAIAFGDGTDYSLAYRQTAGTQGDNVYRRRGRVS